MIRSLTRASAACLQVLALSAALLPGCTLFTPGPPVSPQQAACERQANNAPAVLAIMNKIEGNIHYQREHEDDLRAAKQDATLACLRTQGIVRPGGVERQKPLR